MPVLAGEPWRGREAGWVTLMPEETGENDELLRLAAAGDGTSWEALVDRSRPRLRRMVAFRLDHRLRGRVDPSDVLQDAYLEAWRDLRSYLDRPEIPFFLWLRGIAGNKLRELHRHHLGTQMRDPRREVPLGGGAPAESTTTALAAELLGDLTRASEQAVRQEIKAQLEAALDRHLAPGVAPLGAQVMAMELAHLVAGDAPQPEEEGDLRPVQVRSQVPPGLEVSLLEDVGGIDPPPQPGIEAEGDHPPQPIAAPPHQGLPARAIARRGEPQELVLLARLLRHRSHQQSLPAAPRVDREDRHPPGIRPSGSSPADARPRRRDQLAPNITILPAGRN